MGNSSSNIAYAINDIKKSQLNKFTLSFDISDKNINESIKPFNIVNSHNIKYVYFKIHGIKLVDILPSLKTII